MKNKYDFGIVIGRFQPFHVAHQELVKHALELANKVIIVLGSARSAPDVKNPFTPKMREEMIRNCFPAQSGRLIFCAVRDYPYNDNIWIAEIQNVVTNAIEDDLESEGSAGWHDNSTNETRDPENVATTIIGHFKDRSSYYLNLFPQWSFEELYLNPKEHPEFSVSGTKIRELYFSENNHWKKQIPEQIATYLKEYKQLEYFPAIKREFEYLRKYKEDTRFVGVPYEPVFVTTDAIVVQSGHLLVIKRGFQPGKGLLALPGGFLQKDLTLEDNAIKELKEETRINVPVAVLKGSIKGKKEFDFPDRSQRGRTITFAYFIELESSLKDGLPRVKGGDDASRAFWLPLSALGEKEEEFFEDHMHIVRYFLGR